jgi:GDPmannose 4,6-dehydratase
MKALIFGISGQDGTYLSQLLLNKGYKVFGTSRDSMANHFYNLKNINIKNDIEIATVNLTNFISVLKHIDIIRPDEIYNLAGQTSVALSFKHPFETMKSIVNATLNILEAIRKLDPSIRFYNASSSDCFGNTGEHSANEETTFKPLSPYGAAKTEAHLLVKKYRERYKLHASNGILFNHESPRRGTNFVTNKVVKAAVEIKLGMTEKLSLGNLNATRDWGHAKDYVKAMWMILQEEKADDFVCSTGKSHSVLELVEYVFGKLELDWKDYVTQDQKFMRPEELNDLKGDSSKLRHATEWKPEYTFETMLDEMIQYWMDKYC